MDGAQRTAAPVAAPPDLDQIPENEPDNSWRITQRVRWGVSWIYGWGAWGARGAGSYLHPTSIASGGINVALWGIREFGDQTAGQQRYLTALREFTHGDELGEALAINSQQITDMLFHYVHHTPALSRESPHWASEVLRLPDGRLTWVGTVIEKLDSDGYRQMLYEGNRTMLFKQGTALASRIYSRALNPESDHYDPRFLLNLTKRVLICARDHFQQLAQVMSRHHQTPTPAAMRAEWGEHLHRALTVDSRMSLGGQRNYALHFYLRPQTEQLLRIMCPNGAGDLNVPPGVRGRLWEVIRTTAIPGALWDKLQELFDPMTIDSLLLSFLEAMDTDEPEESYQPPQDRHQADLVRICTPLVRDFLKMLSPNIHSVIERFPGGWDRLGTWIATSIRQTVDGVTIDRVINNAIQDGLPKNVPGHWETDEEGRKRFVPQLQEGEEEFHFKFPRTNAERQEYLDNLDVQRREMEQKLIDKLEGLIHKQLYTKLPTLIRTRFQRWWSALDPWFEGYFGQAGLELKGDLGKVLRFLVIDVFLRLIWLLLGPIRTGLRIGVNRGVRQLAEHSVERLHLDIHKNLLLRVIDVAIDSLRLPEQVPVV